MSWHRGAAQHGTPASIGLPWLGSPLVGMAASAWPGPTVLAWADWNRPFLCLCGIAVSCGGSSDCLLAAVPIAGLALAGFHVSQNEFALE